MDRTPSCLICSSSTKFYTKKNFHNYFKCPSCGLIFLYPSPTAAELNAYYGQEYFISDGSSKRGYDNYNLTIAFKRPFYEFLFFHLKALTPTAVLDVGAAYGDFVQFLKERGLNARGLEISDHAAAAARSRGLNVATSSLEDFAKTPLLPSGRQFDLVTALDVFEHFFNFEEALKSLEKLTASGGHLLIVTPNTKSLTARLLWKHWYQL
ncbi:MAG: putative methyltransferase, partial [Candidatus Magasanikbacteria bacterium]|nr:putative methyltransferase [Candidatus Magasanikbacteria bacterium]